MKKQGQRQWNCDGDFTSNSCILSVPLINQFVCEKTESQTFFHVEETENNSKMEFCLLSPLVCNLASFLLLEVKLGSKSSTYSHMNVYSQSVCNAGNWTQELRINGIVRGWRNRNKMEMRRDWTMATRSSNSVVWWCDNRLEVRLG